MSILESLLSVLYFNDVVYLSNGSSVSKMYNKSFRFYSVLDNVSPSFFSKDFDNDTVGYIRM